MRRGRTRGFTLLELLIAISISALIAAGAYRMLHIALRADSALGAQDISLTELSRSISGLQRDLVQLVGRPIRDEAGNIQPALYGMDRSSTGMPFLEFTRGNWPNPTSENRSELVRVRWQVSEGRLERMYWSALDRSARSEPRVQLLATGITGFRVRYLAEDKKWLDVWPGKPGDGGDEGAVRLPIAIQFGMEFPKYGWVDRLVFLRDPPL